MTDDEWRQRIADQVAARARRAEQRRQLRNQLAAARHHGLTKRQHTRILRAADKEGRPTCPPTQPTESQKPPSTDSPDTADG